MENIHSKAFAQGNSSSPEYHTGLTKLEYVATQIYANQEGEYAISAEAAVAFATVLLEACEKERLG